jgi:hypothetical protein
VQHCAYWHLYPESSFILNSLLWVKTRYHSVILPSPSNMSNVKGHTYE